VELDQQALRVLLNLDPRRSDLGESLDALLQMVYNLICQIL